MTHNNEKEEHWVLDKDGAISGLYVVDVTGMDGIDSWNAIHTVVTEYAQIHPMEIQAQLIQNEMVRKTNKSKTGSNSSKTMRWGLSIPVGLYFKLQQVMPDLFDDNRKLRMFMKKYKGFTTCEHV
jgi:hypothetical protein